jgi:hypothetical protein
LNGVWLPPKAAGCVCRDVPGTACDHCTVWQQQQHPQRPPLRVLRRLPQRQRRPLPVAPPPPPPKPTPPVAVQTRRQSSRSTKGQRLLPTQYRGSSLAPPHHKPAGGCLASGDSDDETDEFAHRHIPSLVGRWFGWRKRLKKRKMHRLITPWWRCDLWRVAMAGFTR